jgi:hypothetical protein
MFKHAAVEKGGMKEVIVVNSKVPFLPSPAGTTKSM